MPLQGPQALELSMGHLQEEAVTVVLCMLHKRPRISLGCMGTPLRRSDSQGGLTHGLGLPPRLEAAIALITPLDTRSDQL